jgi:hypothetical protein
MKTKIITLFMALTALFGIDKIQAQNTGDYRATAPSTVVSTPTTPATITITGTTSVSTITVNDGGAGYSGTAVLTVTGKTSAGATKYVSFAANISGGKVADIQKNAIVFGANTSFVSTTALSATLYPLTLSTVTAQGTTSVTGITITNAGQGYHAAMVKIEGTVSGSVVFLANLNEQGGISSVDITQIVQGVNSGFSGELTATVISASHIGNPNAWEKYDGTSWVTATSLPSLSSYGYSYPRLYSQGNVVTIPSGIYAGGIKSTLYADSLNVQGGLASLYLT